MAIVYEIKERRVIPNWRDFKRTLQLGELSQSDRSIVPIDLDVHRALMDWKQIPNVGTAADLINSAFVAGKRNEEVDKAAALLKTEEGKSSSTLFDLIKTIESNDEVSSQEKDFSILEKDVETVQEFQAFINNKSFHRLIHRTKQRAHLEPLNPVIWVDLARIYSMQGQVKQAEKAMLIALQLAPNNRFVLRSATRFFVHHENCEKALFYLRKCESLRHDPWLVSAHIATSSLMNRFSPFIKNGIALIESGNYSDFELTELTSSIGTLEFKDGSFKKAKALFNKSMREPNDNSLAQLEWVSNDDKRFEIDPFNYNKVINPFEARALDLYEKGSWKEAFYNSIKWFLDMPYSKRPLLLGSYIAGALLKDKHAAKILCAVGLQANPYDPTLLNNMVYSIATSNDFSSLDKYVYQMKEINFKSLPDETKITFQATLGLVALKNGETELGLKLYELSISNASKIRNEHLKNLAIANLTLVLVEQNLPQKSYYIDKVKKIKIQDDEKDLNLLIQEILNKETS